MSLSQFVPSQFATFCKEIRQSHKFKVILTSRKSNRLGVFRVRGGEMSIQMYTGLQPYGFLFTYLHEVAHLRIHLLEEHYGKDYKSHGPEWQEQFRQLVNAVLPYWPEETKAILTRHMRSPRASASADPELYNALYGNGCKTLADLQPGEKFTFRGKDFIRAETLRTRCKAVCVETGETYRISLIANVE
jgi:SprT protein